MCVSKSYYYQLRGPGFVKVPKACGDCWQCRSNRISDYVGRSLCEAAYSDWTVALTLTYADKDYRQYDLAHEIIVKEHFQAFIRSLRDKHHKIRYLVAGEKGDLKGRVHFHVILFGKGKKPQIPHKRNKGQTQDWPQEQRFHMSEWPHGHCWADWSADDRAVRYVCKYILKYEGTSQSWFSLSKKPAIGHAFFQDKAREAIELGVMPSSFEYWPPGGRPGKTYMMTGATKRDYLQTITDNWQGKLPEKWRVNEWVAQAIESNEMKRFKAENEAYTRARPLSEYLASLQETLDVDRIKPEAVSAILWNTSPDNWQHDWCKMQEPYHGTKEIDSRPYVAETLSILGYTPEPPPRLNWPLLAPATEYWREYTYDENGKGSHGGPYLRYSDEIQSSTRPRGSGAYKADPPCYETA